MSNTNPESLIKPSEVVSASELVRDFYNRVVNPQVAAALVKADGKSPTVRILREEPAFRQTRPYLPILLMAEEPTGQEPKATLLQWKNIMCEGKPGHPDGVGDFAMSQDPNRFGVVINVKEETYLKGKSKIYDNPRKSPSHSRSIYFVV